MSSQTASRVTVGGHRFALTANLFGVLNLDKEGVRLDTVTLLGQDSSVQILAAGNADIDDELLSNCADPPNRRRSIWARSCTTPGPPLSVTP